MKIERQNIIDQEINKQGFVLVPAMSEMLKCSEETIRRDLKEMALSEFVSSVGHLCTI